MICGDGGNLHAHHLIPPRIMPELIIVLSNGVTVCIPCHAIIHNRVLGDKRMRKGERLKLLIRMERVKKYYLPKVG